jgi:hypothetical protein
MRPLMQRMLRVALTMTWRREEIVERVARRMAVWERERHDREAGHGRSHDDAAEGHGSSCGGARGEGHVSPETPP